MRRPSVIFLLALSCGIWWQLNDYRPALYVGTLISLSLLFDPSKRKAVIILIGIASGFGLTQLEKDQMDRLNNSLSVQEHLVISGIVYQRDFLDLNSCWLKMDNGLWVRLRFSPYKPTPNVSSGMKVRISGTYLPPEASRNPNGFNEKRWLHTKKAVGTLDVAAFKSIHGGSAIEQWRYKIGLPLVTNLMQNTGFKQGPMAAGMLLGEDSWIPPEVIEAYKVSGTNHILSVSGAHFGVLLFWVYKLMEQMQISYKSKKIIIWGLLGAFIWLIGADSAAVRAYYMFLILDITRLSYKQPDSLNGLCLTLSLMLLLNPLMIWDVGLHLACAAMYGIVVIAASINRSIQLTSHMLMNKFVYSLVLSLSVCVCLYPILCTQFNYFTWWSIIYNVPVSIFSAISLPLSSMVAITAWFKPVSRGLGLLSGGTLWLMTEAVKTSLILPTLKAVPSLTSVQYALYMSILLIPLYFKQVQEAVVYVGRIHTRKSTVSMFSNRLVYSLILGTFLILSQYLPKHIALGNEMQVSFLDVGQGDGTVIKTPSGKVIVIDAGLNKGRLLVTDSLLKMGIDRIDLLVISHPHADHLGGATMLLEKLTVSKLVYFDGNYSTEDSAVLKSLLACSLKTGTRIQNISKGDRIDIENNILLECLHPDKNFDSESANDESLVLQLMYGNTNFLFTGDISTQVECDIIGKVRDGHTVLKVPHHGSATSSGNALVSLKDLELAIIQVGKKNRYGHPKDSTLERYYLEHVPILRNDINGCVQIYSNGKQLWYKVLLQEDGNVLQQITSRN